MCRLCGREACAECFEQVKELTEDRPGANEADIAQLQLKREKHSHSNPFFLACTRRNEHQSKDFSPMSRFCKSELGDAITEMEALLKTPDIDALPLIGAIDPTLEEFTQTNGDHTSGLSTNGNAPVLLNTSSSSMNQAGTQPESSQNILPSHVAQIDPALTSAAEDIEIPSYTPQYFTDAELTEDAFRPVWQKGQPIVVTNLLSKFKLQWTPEYFIEKHGSQSCLILECQTDVNKRITVGQFFSWFGKYEGRVECWKLKVVIIRLCCQVQFLIYIYPRIGLATFY